MTQPGRSRLCSRTLAGIERRQTYHRRQNRLPLQRLSGHSLFQHSACRKALPITIPRTRSPVTTDPTVGTLHPPIRGRTRDPCSARTATLRRSPSSGGPFLRTSLSELAWWTDRIKCTARNDTSKLPSCRIGDMGTDIEITVRSPSVLTVQQLAERWMIHPKTIQRHVRTGTFPIPALLPDARALRFSMVAIERHEHASLAA